MEQYKNNKKGAKMAKKSRIKILIVIGWFCAILIVCLLGFAFYNSYLLRCHGAKTIGIVYEKQPRKGQIYVRYNYSVLSEHYRGGQFLNNSEYNLFEIGDSLIIRYNTSLPSFSIVDIDSSLKRWPTLYKESEH